MPNALIMPSDPLVNDLLLTPGVGSAGPRPTSRSDRCRACLSSSFSRPTLEFLCESGELRRPQRSQFLCGTAVFASQFPKQLNPLDCGSQLKTLSSRLQVPRTLVSLHLQPLVVEPAFFGVLGDRH